MKSLVRLIAIVAGTGGLFCSIALLSGNGHLLTAIRDLYLRGRITPAITESGSSLTHYVRELPVGVPQPWPVSATLNRPALSSEVMDRMTSFRTAAFLVIEDGAVTREIYWPGFDARSRTNSNSVAKTVVGMLIGVALKEGKLQSLDQPIADFIPEFAQDERAKLSVRHLLTMSAASDFTEDYDNPMAFPARAHFGNDIKRLLINDFHVVGEPGKIHKYDSSNTALLGLVLAQATGQSLSSYAAEKLWKPLGAERPELWSLDHADGIERAYCCLYATARDYARLGQLYLDGGRLRDQQLIPAAFVAQAIGAAPLSDASGNRTDRYGFQLWRMQHRGHAVFYGWGYQGQYIAVIPDRKMVMVRLGDGGGYTQEHYRLDLPLYLDAALDPGT